MKALGQMQFRLFILSDSPPEKDVQWSEQGMLASFKFIQKFWLLNNKIAEKIKNSLEKEKQEGDEELIKFTNRLINKMNSNLEKFNYNVIIANIHETYNFLSKALINEFSKSVLKDNFRKILIVMSPVMPHIIHECFEINNFDIHQKWPSVNKKYLEEEIVSIVVQISGKKEGLYKQKKMLKKKQLWN